MKEIKKCFSCLYKNLSQENLLCQENLLPKENLLSQENLNTKLIQKKNNDFQPQNTDWVCFIGNKHPHSQIYCDCLYKSVNKKQG